MMRSRSKKQKLETKQKWPLTRDNFCSHLYQHQAQLDTQSRHLIKMFPGYEPAQWKRGCLVCTRHTLIPSTWSNVYGKCKPKCVSTNTREGRKRKFDVVKVQGVPALARHWVPAAPLSNVSESSRDGWPSTYLVGMYTSTFLQGSLHYESKSCKYINFWSTNFTVPENNSVCSFNHPPSVYWTSVKS